MDTNRGAVVTVLESVNGTFVEPQASDSNVVYIGTGQPTVALGNESLGKLLDGSYDDAAIAGGQQVITMPDFMIEVKPSLTVDVEPKWWKEAKMCGAKVEDNGGALALVFDGFPDCTTASAKFTQMSCSSKATEWTGRGMRGNMSIGWETANANVMATVSGLTGAYVGKEDKTGVSPIEVVGDDDTFTETAAKYITTIGGAVYQVHVHSFDAGNSVTMRPANNESGIATSAITGREKRVKFSMTMLDSGDTILEDAQANATDTITLVGTGDAGYDITFEGCQQLDPSIGDIDGTVAWEIETTVKKATYQLK